MKHNASHILKLADSYFTQIKRSDVRFWAVESLISLAARYSQFKNCIKRLIGREIPDPEWEQWLNINSNLLGPLPSYYWSSDGQVPNSFKTSLDDDDEKVVYITLGNNEPDTISISSSSYLQGVGAIPQLWLWKGDLMAEREPYSKQIAHYGWLAKSIEVLTEDSSDPFFRDDLEAFVIGNTARLAPIRKWFQHEPRVLGGGSDGVAWDIGDRKILKIFTDPVSYNAAVEAVQRIHQNPALGKTEAMIYDVGVIGKFENRDIFYYIMEKMAPVTDVPGLKEQLKYLVTKIVGKIYAEREVWRSLKRRDFKTDAEYIKRKVKEASRKYADSIMQRDAYLVRGVQNTWDLNRVKINSPDSGPTSYQHNDKTVEMPGEQHVIPLSKNWLPSLCEEVLMKYLTGRGDLHMGNLGVTAYGEFRYFDPVYKGWESQINMGGGFVPQADRI